MTPSVSIGLPVYNGQDYLQSTIESILGQSYEDFELIISDNGSSDATPDIAGAAAADRRVRFYRSQTNRGAAWNFNRVAAMARGEFFKWSAHDDICAPDFLARCVDIFGVDPTTSVAFTRVKIIDSQGQPCGYYQTPPELASPDPHRRFRFLLRDRLCYEIFGLIRAAALKRTGLMGNYPHADGILLTRLGLVGPIRRADEALFLARRHPRQSGSVMKNRHMWAIWWDPANGDRRILPSWAIYKQYFNSVRNAPLGHLDRLLCYRQLLRELLSGFRAVDKGGLHGLAGDRRNGRGGTKNTLRGK